MSEQTQKPNDSGEWVAGKRSSWALLGPRLFIVLQLGALIVLTRELPLPLVSMIEGSLIGVLGLSLLLVRPRLRAFATYLATVSSLGAIVAWAQTSDVALSLIGLAVVLVVVILLYGVHRYQRVSMGLVSEREPHPGTTGGES